MSQPASWRFIVCAEYNGEMNMAIDEAMLESHIAGETPPTLRLYRFAPPAVTIGLSQKMPVETVASIRRHGIDVARRPTGGRAVLHMNDLTYAVVGSDTTCGGTLSSSVTRSYKEICAGLIEAFRILGVQAEIGEASAPYRHLQDCFMATTSSDLHYGGVKLTGSAQMRRRGGVLQHGSVPLDQDPALMPRVLGDRLADPAALRHRNLFDVCGREVGWAELETAFKRGFELAFGVPLVAGGLTDAELTSAKSKRQAYKGMRAPGLMWTT